jgi:glycosyltransferase involved in cell wall biosynthesis
MNRTTPDAVAVVHEWLTEWGGSEDCVRLIAGCFPQAKLYATIDFLSDADRARLGGRPVTTTWLQKAPGVRRKFWNYLPVTALAVETHDLSEAQMIVSSSHAFAKGVLTRGDQLHVSYVHSPMRYAWDLHHQYLADYGLTRGAKGLLARAIFHRLRMWDRQTANNVDLFLANSRHVQQRIWRAYRRRSRVLHPPVRTQAFRLQAEKDDHYVTVSRLVSYKRIDLMLDAFARMPQRKLVVVGDGPEMPRLQRMCPPNVQLMGQQPNEVVERELQRGRAFLFAAQEDFGIAPVEAQACGTPVIAYGAGGSLETVRARPGEVQPTGVFFPEQTAQSLIEAIEAFERARGVFDPHVCRAWAEGFSEERFSRDFTTLTEQAWAAWQQDPTSVESALIA